MARWIAFPPAHRLTWAIGGLLAALPLVVDARSTLILLTQVFIFAVFAMSYDLLLGYTGIVSFGHAMFFGIGAYTFALLMKIDAGFAGLLAAIVVSALLTAAVSFVVGMLSLRLKSHFYAMLTLSFSGLFLVAAEKWRTLTMGNDGFTFPIPDALKDRVAFYYLALAFLVLLYAAMRRFTLSPVGRVLQAIRENEPRAESLGYTTLHYKVLASVVAGVAAGWCGGMYALTLRFVNTSVFSVNVTLDALLMTIIGGVGTLAGGFVGSALIQLAHQWLSELAKVHWIFERWIIFFGLLYIVVVLFFPLGIVGTARQWIGRRRGASAAHPIDGSSAPGEKEVGAG